RRGRTPTPGRLPGDHETPGGHPARVPRHLPEGGRGAPDRAVRGHQQEGRGRQVAQGVGRPDEEAAGQVIAPGRSPTPPDWLRAPRQAEGRCCQLLLAEMLWTVTALTPNARARSAWRAQAARRLRIARTFASLSRALWLRWPGRASPIPPGGSQRRSTAA